MGTRALTIACRAGHARTDEPCTRWEWMNQPFDPAPGAFMASLGFGPEEQAAA
jgi:hypothetical protein